MRGHLVSQAQPEKPFRFSTVGMDEPRAELWALNDRGIVLPLEPVAGAAVHAVIAQWPYPQLGILSATLCGLRHGTSGGPSGRAANEDHLYFGITLTGRSIAQRRGDQITLEHGDAVLLSGLEGFRLTHPDHVNFLGLRLSRTLLETRLDNIEDAVMRLVRRDTPALGLLTRYVAVAIDDSLPVTVELQGLTASHVYQLVAMAVGSERERALSANGLGIRVARLRTIKADICANLADCGLGVATIAARHHVSPRYVHKLFEYEGTTFSEYVLWRRLAYVHQMLTDPRFAGHSISALAFKAGFGDLSYFNRVFRRRYNVTPSDVRHVRDGSSRRAA